MSNVLEKIFENRKLAECYRSLGTPENIKRVFEAREKVTGKKYGTHTKAVYLSKFRARGYVNENGLFTKEFYDMLRSVKETKQKSNDRIQEYMDNVEITDSIDIDSEIVLDDIYEMMSRNIKVNFNIPKGQSVCDIIDFNDSRIQVVNLNNLSHYVRYPQYVKYVYVCPRCGTEYVYKENTVNSCKPCKIKTKLKYDLSESRSCYIYVLEHKNEQYVTRSLVELPLGDFTAAVFVVKDLKSYSLFIIATRQPKKPEIKLSFNKEEDRLKQLVDIIDDIHKKQIGKQIHGLLYYKYAILLTALASYVGYTSYNIQMAGDGGTGKTATPRLYLSTIIQKTKLQDSNNLSKPGTRGSTKIVTIEGSTYTIHEPGLLERNNVTILDEFLDIHTDEATFMKSVLGANTMSVEIANNRTEIRKNSTVISTGNIPRWVKEKRNKYLFEGKDPQTEFAISGSWYVDGQNFNILDRYALLFYIHESDRKSDFNTNDNKLSDLELRQILYTPEIDEYLKECSKIKTFMSESIKQKLVSLCDKMYDPIHTKSRKEIYVSITAQLHAIINGRSPINDDDVKFVKDMFSKCFTETNASLLNMECGKCSRKLDVWAFKTVLSALGIAGKNKIRNYASKDYDVSNFETIFDDCLHYGEICMVAPDRYRNTEWIDSK